MQLDVPTLMALGSFVTAGAGVVLLFGWLQNRKTAGFAIWGLGDLVAAAGVFFMMLGVVSHLPLRSFLGATLLALSQGLAWKAARTFDAKPAPLPLVVLGMLLVVVANFTPGLQSIAGAVGPGVGTAYMASIAISLWLGREERLPARWPLIVLTAIHTVMLTIAIFSFYNRAVGAGQIPSVMSLFGLIHFESMIFFVGTAVFILCLVRERAEAASQATAKIDPLTGIANRSALMEGAERIVERCKRDNAPVSIMMFDLDGFKAINDTHGHSVGDEVIKKFCEVTIAMLRPTDIFGRMGGEEFAVVIPGGIEAAAERADCIRALFAASCRFLKGVTVDATVSAGVAASDNAQEYTLSALFEDSDRALYSAKSAGRNRIERAHQDTEHRLSSAIRVA